MLTQSQVLESVKNKTTHSRESCEMIDGRDFVRLIDFFPVNEWEVFGFKLKDGVETSPPKPWTKDDILKQLKEDLDFAFEKAENQRGISSSLMFEVIKMWMWILEDSELSADGDYDNYGMSFYRKVDKKYFSKES